MERQDFAVGYIVAKSVSNSKAPFWHKLIALLLVALIVVAILIFLFFVLILLIRFFL